MIYILAYAVSFLLGHLFLTVLLPGKKALPPSLHIVFAMALGLAFSASIAYFGFIVSDKLDRPFIFLVHLFAFLFLF